MTNQDECNVCGSELQYDRKDGAVALAGKVLDFVISMGEGK